MQPDFRDLAALDVHHDHLVLLEGLTFAGGPGLVQDNHMVIIRQDVVGLDLGRGVEYLHLLLEHLCYAVLAPVVAGHRSSTWEVHDSVVGVKAEEAFHVTLGQRLGGTPGDILVRMGHASLLSSVRMDGGRTLPRGAGFEQAPPSPPSLPASLKP